MTDPTLSGDGEANEESKAERVQVQDPKSLDEADRDLEQWLKAAPSEIVQQIFKGCYELSVLDGFYSRA